MSRKFSDTELLQYKSNCTCGTCAKIRAEYGTFYQFKPKIAKPVIEVDPEAVKQEYVLSACSGCGESLSTRIPGACCNHDFCNGCMEEHKRTHKVIRKIPTAPGGFGGFAGEGFGGWNVTSA